MKRIKELQAEKENNKQRKQGEQNCEDLSTKRKHDEKSNALPNELENESKSKKVRKDDISEILDDYDKQDSEFNKKDTNGDKVRIINQLNSSDDTEISDKSQKFEETKDANGNSSETESRQEHSRNQTVEERLHSLEKAVLSISQGQKEMVELLKGSQQVNVIKPLKAELYENSDFFVDNRRLTDAINAGTGCAFSSRLLTAMAGVSSFYRTSVSGQFRSSSGEKKKKLDLLLHDHLYKAACKHFPKDDKLSKTSFNQAIGNKLLALDKLFKKMKKGEEFNLSKMEKLSEMDVIGFEDFQNYKDDPSLFDQLDAEVDKD